MTEQLSPEYIEHATRLGEAGRRYDEAAQELQGAENRWRKALALVDTLAAALAEVRRMPTVMPGTVQGREQRTAEIEEAQLTLRSATAAADACRQDVERWTQRRADALAAETELQAKGTPSTVWVEG